MITDFDVETALAYARRDDIETWLHAYLTTGAWANHALSDGLKREQRWWRGPFEVSLDTLTRCCGPEPEMEFVMDRTGWNERVDKLSASFTDFGLVPPLLAESRPGILSIRDGNHRHEAIRRKGWQTCWVIVWYNSRADYDADSSRPIWNMGRNKF